MATEASSTFCHDCLWPSFFQFFPQSVTYSSSSLHISEPAKLAPGSFRSCAVEVYPLTLFFSLVSILFASSLFVPKPKSMAEKAIATWKDAKLLSKFSATVSGKASPSLRKTGTPLKVIGLARLSSPHSKSWVPISDLDQCPVATMCRIPHEHLPYDFAARLIPYSPPTQAWSSMYLLLLMSSVTRPQHGKIQDCKAAQEGRSSHVIHEDDIAT
jgi:hypothetical protein